MEDAPRAARRASDNDISPVSVDFHQYAFFYSCPVSCSMQVGHLLQDGAEKEEATTIVAPSVHAFECAANAYTNTFALQGRRDESEQERFRLWPMDGRTGDGFIQGNDTVEACGYVSILLRVKDCTMLIKNVQACTNISVCCPFRTTLTLTVTLIRPLHPTLGYLEYGRSLVNSTISRRWTNEKTPFQ